MPRQTTRLIWILAFALALTALLSVATGLAGGNLFSAGTWKIVRILRLPRLLASMLAGCALALSGLIIQTVLNNSLASASLLGISSGAGFFSLLAGALFPASFIASSSGGFAGGLLCALLISALVLYRKPSKLTIVLAGMAVSALFSAGIDLLLVFFPDLLSGYAAFKIGSFASVTMRQVYRSAMLTGPACLIVWCCKRELEMFGLGNEQAESLGLSVSKWTAFFMALAAWLASAAVSCCGLLGFVGLIVPAALRRWNLSLDRLIVCTILAGALLCALADWIGRIAVLPWELPAGLVLSLLGGPYFLYLLLERKGDHV